METLTNLSARDFLQCTTIILRTSVVVDVGVCLLYIMDGCFISTNLSSTSLAEPPFYEWTCSTYKQLNRRHDRPRTFADLFWKARLFCSWSPSPESVDLSLDDQARDRLTTFTEESGYSEVSCLPQPHVWAIFCGFVQIKGAWVLRQNLVCVAPQAVITFRKIICVIYLG